MTIHILMIHFWTNGEKSTSKGLKKYGTFYQKPIADYLGAADVRKDFLDFLYLHRNSF
jgi:hypothetical protein